MAALWDQNRPGVPFPIVYGNKGERLVSDGLSLRPFGSKAEDLTIDFEHPPRPWLEISILRCCTTDDDGNTPSNDFFWNLDVSKRLECLLAVVSLSEPSRQIAVDLRCLNAECLEALELEFSMQEIAGIQKLGEAHNTFKVDIGGKHVTLRKPTGLDQINWRANSYADESAAAWAMIKFLLPDDQHILLDQEKKRGNAWLQTVNQVMEEMDPLTNFHLKTNCPVCEHRYDYAIDFGKICLQKLRDAQNRLIERVHTLAFHYHWNDQEIFALPSWRLERHLRLIEREEKR